MKALTARVSALLLWALPLAPAWAAPAPVSVDTGAHGEVQAHHARAAEPARTLVWLLSEHGLTDGVAALADGLADAGVDVWLLDPFQTWFLPTTASSLADYDPDALAAAIDTIAATRPAHAVPAQAPLFIASNDRAGGVLLNVGARVTTPALRGAVLVSPNVYRHTPAPGDAATYLPAALDNRLPLFLMIPRLSTLALRQDTLQRDLGLGGTPVWTQSLDAVRDRFFFRPDATAAEHRLAVALPAQLTRAMRLLERTPRPAPATRSGASDTALETVPATARQSPPPTRTLQAHRGDPAPPPLRLPDLDDTVHDLARYRGRVVLLNFWASWCPPCVHEMPSMARVQARHGHNHFQILAVNLGEPRDAVEAFLAAHPVNFPVLLDPAQHSPRTWRVFAFPTSYLLDRAGRIRYAVAGGLAWDDPEVLAVIDALLAEPESPEQPE